MEVARWVIIGDGERENGGKGTGNSMNGSINGRYKIDRGRLRIV